MNGEVEACHYFSVQFLNLKLRETQFNPVACIVSACNDGGKISKIVICSLTEAVCSFVFSFKAF